MSLLLRVPEDLKNVGKELDYVDVEAHRSEDVVVDFQRGFPFSQNQLGVIDDVEPHQEGSEPTNQSSQERRSKEHVEYDKAKQSEPKHEENSSHHREIRFCCEGVDRERGDDYRCHQRGNYDCLGFEKARKQAPKKISN